MRAEKTLITREYIGRLNASPFAIVVDYKGLTVAQFSELRRRLAREGAEIHVVKNSILRVAAKEVGLPELGTLAGQLAVVTGQKDISAAAKVVKKFQTDSEKPRLKFGFLNNQRLEVEQLSMLADLPSLEVLRAKLLGLFQAPASRLVRLLNTPATQLARVLKARAEQAPEATAG